MSDADTGTPLQAWMNHEPREAMFRQPTYRVNELFDSIQGEGVLAGTPCTFIRLQGCTVGCSWCDSGPLADLLEKRATNGETRNTWGRGGYRHSVNQIMDGVHKNHVVITGGEPTLYNLDPLIQTLRQYEHFIQLETSGQNELKGVERVDWVTWSPKENLGFKAPLSIMRMAREVKWVVDDTLPFRVVEETYRAYLEMRIKPPTFVLMPEGCPPTNEHILKCLEWLERVPHAWQRHWRFGDRLQYRLGLR